jgi:hypothetical protein
METAVRREYPLSVRLMLGVWHRSFTFAKGTLGRFLLVNRISFAAERVQENPAWREHRFPAYHWKLTLTRPDGRTYQGFFSMGTGLGPYQPTAEQFLQTMVDDSRMYFQALGSLQEYAWEWGFDPSDPKVQEDFERFAESVLGFREFLGPEAFNVLVYQLEGEES